MNTKLLKQKILDLAIRGKLTQQLKSDGTARELLEQISSKVSSSSSTLSSPRRRGSPSSSAAKTIIPLDKSEAPFEIPANWEWVRLGDVCELISGQDFPPEKYNAEKKGLPYITGASNFVNNHVILNRWTEYPSVIAQKGDILLVCKGSGYGNYVYADFEKAHIARQIMAIRISDKTLNAYVYNFLGSQYEHLKFQGNGLVPGIARSVVLDLTVPLPPLAEQQRIVAKIEEAFAEIDAIEKNKELLKTHIKQTRQKILNLAIHGKLVPQNKSDEPASVLLERITRDNPHYEKLTDVPFEIPDSWEWVKLGYVGKWQSGTTPSKSNSSYYKDGTIPWLNTGDLNDGIIREIPQKVTEKALAETSLRLNEAGSVCIAMYGATIGKIGILSMPATTNQACCVCNNLKNFVNQMWLFYFLKNHKQEFIEAGFGGAQPNISKEKITATLFPLPPLAEQKRIVNKIDEIFASLDEISLHLV